MKRLPGVHRQVRRHKAGVIFAGVLSISVAVGILVLQTADWDAGLTGMGIVLPVTVGAMVLMLVVVLLLHERMGKNDAVLEKLSETQLAQLDEQLAGQDLYRQRVTVAPPFAVINLNGYALRLLPLADIRDVRIDKRRYKGREVEILHIETKGKPLRFPVGRPELWSAQEILAALRAHLRSGEAGDAVYCASFEALEPGYEEVYDPFLVVSVYGQEELVLARLVGPDVEQTLDEACSDVLNYVRARTDKGLALTCRWFPAGDARERERIAVLRREIALVQAGLRQG